MKVVYDHQVFSFQRYGGISRYFTELLRRFATVSDIRAEVWLEYSDNRYLAGLDRPPLKPLLGDRPFPGRQVLLQILNRRHCRARLRRETFDLFHPTFYHPYFLADLDGRPFVLTIHDMTIERFPGASPLVAAVRRDKRLLAARAARIIAVSETTKADVLRFLPVEESRIRVVHHGCVLPDPDPTADARLRLPAAYVLFVGNRGGYKNFAALLDALPRVLREHADVDLLCVGGGPFTRSERSRLAALGLERRVHWRSVSDAELSFIYARARLLALPSLHEGFGFPVLEAFSHDCPAALSRAGSLREIAADAAVYFDPRATESLAEAVSRLLRDRPLRDRLIARGRRRLADFDWETTARKTAAVYRELV